MTVNDLPKISIIIPTRNEGKNIEKCLKSILDNDYPRNKLRIIIVDGESEDETVELASKVFRNHPNVSFKISKNPQKFTPYALNIGIKEAESDEIIVIVGAHNFISRNYLRIGIQTLLTHQADCVGGRGKCIHSSTHLIGRAIPLALNSVFGTGGSFRNLGEKGNVIEVDTVPSPIYKKSVFEKIGLFNENLKRSQDMEFNLRLRKASGKILLAPDIVSYYYPKSNLKDFFFHNIEDGIWVIYPLKFVKMLFKLRHYIPLIFVLTLPLSIWLYILVSLFFSAQIAFREKDIRYFFVMPAVFATRHIGYGLGSVWGLIKLII